MVYPFLDSPYKKGYLVQEIFRFIFLVIVLVLFFVEYIWKKNSNRPREPKEVFLTLDFILSVIIFALFLAIFILRMIAKKDNKIFDVGKFHDTFYVAKILNYANNLDGIILILELAKIISFVRVTNISSLIFPFFIRSFKLYFIYFIFILAIIFGFTIGGKLLWGYDIEGYNAFGNCFVSTMVFLLGYYNVEDLLEYNEGFGVAYIILFSIMDLFFIFGVIHAIFGEMFRRTIVETGYPEDMDHENWNMNDFKTWIIHFIPEQVEAKKGAAKTKTA
ncbi:MAG: hypothetical protein MJ252_09325 [archaeon]|nr:hypothetical protein [archaeon]